MSFWKKLFGGSESGAAPTPTAHGEAVEHKGFTIQPAPYKEGSEFQTWRDHLQGDWRRGEGTPA